MARDDMFLEVSPEEADEINREIGEILGFGPGKETEVYDIPEPHPTNPKLMLMRIEREFILENPKVNGVINPERHAKLKQTKPQIYVDAQRAKEDELDLGMSVPKT